jgi:hypothetical protein
MREQMLAALSMNLFWFWISTEFMKSTRKGLELKEFATHTRS